MAVFTANDPMGQHDVPMGADGLSIPIRLDLGFGVGVNLGVGRL